MQKNPISRFVNASIDYGLAKLAGMAPTVPCWYSALRALRTKGTDEEQRLGVYQLIRRDHRLPAEISFFLIARQIDLMMVLDEDERRSSSGIKCRMDAIRKAAGLGDDDDWPPGEVPPEYQRLDCELEEADKEIFAQRLEQCNELEMAAMHRADPKRFHEIVASGRTRLMHLSLAEDGPEVEEELLAALVRGELPEDEARRVYQLVHSVRHWHDAHERLLLKALQ